MKKTEQIKLKFIGGAGTVTGSCTLVEYREKRILIDCGMFQGLKNLRVKNREDFPIDPRLIDDVILTHAHLDHCGRLPVLVNKGFSGRIHAAVPTAEVAAIILRDSAKIQEEEAEHANKYGYTEHTEAKPLYTADDVEKTLRLFHEVNYSSHVILDGDFKFQFHNAGHILGAALVELQAHDITVVFSGDLGRQDSKVMFPPKHLKHADYIVLESTYGNRNHPEIDPETELEEVVNETIGRGGILIIPSFAVERAQEIIYYLSNLIRDGRIPKIPVYLDSPMGVDATEVFFNYSDLHQLSHEDVNRMRNNAILIKDYYRSQSVLHDKKPKIVLAGSGMLTGGRVLHYLEKHISNPLNTILLAGFQADGTRGRSLQNGEKELKFFGQRYAVKIEVKCLQGLSAHADQKGLIDWIAGFRTKPKKIFLNHGEPHTSHILKLKIQDTLKINTETAQPELNYLLRGK